ncbi:T9SS type A sorting domain-containing protein [Dyadobacter crusticola]|uniref:T9SS type A sorting domain-containing protein n=1 Tax=Dyadobacter crusticola TaxID=292407 RepID=UPI0004E1C04A|nr:T9SS type A sorting domain-containing protein [Dyadobacter crusticola]
MRKFSVLLILFLLNLGLTLPGFSTGADCGCLDAQNAIKNGSFESGTNYWSKTDGTNFGIDAAYNMCGSKNGLITGSGTVYQVVDLAGGSQVDLSIYGGTHNNSKTHQFKLTFYTSNNQEIGGDENRKVINMDYEVRNNQLRQYTTSITAPANAAKVVLSIYSSGDYFKFDVACMSVTPPAPADCGCPDSENALANGSFESGTVSWSRTSGTNFGTDNEYSQCGAKYGFIDGAGTIYQEVNVSAGAKVDVSVYGGTHDAGRTHQFWLTFYNSAGQKIDGGHNQVVDMNYKVTQYHKLEQYKLSGTAPAGAAKVRLSAYSSGNYFKIDVACMNITTPPPTDCGCPDAQNAVKNGSFESGTDAWTKSAGTNFSQDEAYSVCGSKNGVISGAGSIYQEINLTPGSVVNLKVFGGTHDTSRDHVFKLEFYTSSGQLITIPVNNDNQVQMDYRVTQTHKLQEYNLTATAPLFAAKVRFSVVSNGDYFKIDGVCMSITPPSKECESCSDNKLTNASFEDGTVGWTTTGNVSAETIIANCGSKSLILQGAGSFRQDVAVDGNSGNTANLIFYGAVTENRDQRVQIIFLDGSGKVLGTITRDVDKIVDDAPWGLQKYVLAGTMPAGTTIVRIQASGSENYLAIDGTCLTFTGPALPVTLASFHVKKEGTTASLAWTTTLETNSDHFDVQHSGDGKNWSVLATLAAQGESKGTISYSYTHTSPSAANLYRLKMVDADGTFAYSSIKSLNFDVDGQMSIYPNPTSDRIRFTGTQQISNVKLYNVSGVLVLNTSVDAENEVDLTKLAQGTYFVRVNDGTTTRKIVVVR